MNKFMISGLNGLRTSLFALLITAIFTPSTTLKAQSFNFTYDHYSFIVEDLETTGAFYADVLGLEEIPHPSATEGFRWFRVKGNTQIHLIGKDQRMQSNSKSTHLCLAVDDLEGFISHLDAIGEPYWDWPGNKKQVTLRADGVRQIYLQDPEGNWIEINTAEH